ncbi:MAG: RNA-directed DNA polymerase, partial [Enterococcus thailandicus]|nr:RNA-directed DNA polymerase [Enterococcus thailandicus]
SFTSSEEWFVLNSKFKYFIRTDYKSCFDNIYTHTYKWLIGKDVNDTKNFKNVNVYTIIDRVLQNINSRTSNGIVIGPEFSRMIAEILLQGIDSGVYSYLLNKGLVNGEDYKIYRYVDDIFIFSESEGLADEIVNTYSSIARKYLLHLNDNKLSKNKIPFILDVWLNDTNLFVNRVSTTLFTSKEEQRGILEKHLKENNISQKSDTNFKPYIFKEKMFYLTKKSLMNQFNRLICDFEEKNKTIVAYFMGMLLNKVKRNKTKMNIFRENVSAGTVFDFLHFVFYIYSFYPDFNNTQRLLSILSYIRDEFDIYQEKDKLQSLINKYAFIFEKANLNDIVNLILFFSQARVEIPFKQECRIVEKLRKKDDPILWASYMIYAKYSNKYYTEIQSEVCKLIQEHMEAILSKDSIYTYREFWWLLIFNKSPYITNREQAIFDNIISGLQVKTGNDKTAGDICGNLFVEFLTNSSNQFFEWNIVNKDFLRNITFKTYERSIFKNYKEGLNFMNWSSI